jgi:hypothetical protein
MKPVTRTNLRQMCLVVILVLVCLFFRRVFYFFDLVAIEVRYFWWLFLILAVGLWLLTMIGRLGK